MKIRNAFIFIAVLMAAAVISGCGFNDVREDYDSAVASLEEENYEAASESYKKVIDSGKYLAEAYRGLGIAQLSLADYSDAAISFSKAQLNMQSNDAEFARDIKMYLAYCRQMQGETSKALELYNELITEKEDPDLLYYRGKIYMSQGETDEAKADFSRAAELTDNYELYISIYEVYDSYKMGADGSEFLEKALEIAEGNESDHFALGVINYYLQDYDGAKEELIAALRTGSDDEKAMMLLGKTYLAMEDIADARALYKEYTGDDNSAPEAYNGLALCDMAEEDYDSALENIEKGIELNDTEANRSLLFNEILIYEHKQEWDTAKEKAARYTALYPLEEEGVKEEEFLSTR